MLKQKTLLLHQHLNVLRTKFYVPDASQQPFHWAYADRSRRVVAQNQLVSPCCTLRGSQNGQRNPIQNGFQQHAQRHQLLRVFCHRTQLRLCTTQSWAFLFPRKHLDAATFEHQDSPWHGGHIPRRVAETNNASRSYAWRSFRRRHDLHGVKARQQPTQPCTQTSFRCTWWLRLESRKVWNWKTQISSRQRGPRQLSQNPAVPCFTLRCQRRVFALFLTIFVDLFQLWRCLVRFQLLVPTVDDPCHVCLTYPQI